MSETLRESVMGDDAKAGRLAAAPASFPRPSSVMSVLDRRINMPVAAMARVIALHKKATTTLIQKMD
jgi:hypothetical protein